MARMGFLKQWRAMAAQRMAMKARKLAPGLGGRVGSAILDGAAFMDEFLEGT